MDQNSWFCQVNGQQYGPYALQHLQQYVAEGRLKQSSLVRHASSGQWIAASLVPGLFASTAVGQQPAAQPVGAAQFAAPQHAAAQPHYSPQAGAPAAATVANTSTATADDTADELQDEEVRASPLLFYTMIALVLIVLGGAGGLAAVIYQRRSGDNVHVQVEPEKNYSSSKAQAGSDRIQMALNGVERWTDALSVTKLQAKSFRLQLASVWSPPPEKGAGTSDRFLYVEVRVLNMNKGGRPLHFTTWNSDATPQKMPTAVMIDNQGRLCPLVSGSSENGEANTTVMQLNPGEEVSDILVFEYPQAGFDHVNLALSYESIDQGTRYFGFKIPRSMIGTEQTEPEGSGPRSSGAQRAGDKEPSLQEINRQLERYKRQEQEERKRSMDANQ